MKKYILTAVILLAVCAISSGCRSSATSCWTRNGSRVPTQVYANPVNTYPVEEVIYAAPSAVSQCNACTPNACVPACAAPACDPCGPTCSGTSGARYGQAVLPGGIN